MRDFLNERIKSLGLLSQKHSKMLDDKTSVIDRAWDFIRRGVRPTGSEPEVIAAWTDLVRHAGKMFNVGDNAIDNILGNTLFRSNTGLDYINDLLGQYRVLGNDVTPPNNVYINLDEAREVSRTTGKTLLEAAADQWRTWPVKDPIDFLARMNAAAIRMAADVAFVEKFIARAKADNLVFSTKAEGLVPLRPSGKSRYGRLFPEEEIYVPQEIADLFKRIDEVSQESRVLDSELGKFINGVLDPITNTWKYAITLPVPATTFVTLTATCQ